MLGPGWPFGVRITLSRWVVLL